MKLAVFAEFAAVPEARAAIAAVVPLDVAPAATERIETDEERRVVATNAKLLFDPAAVAPSEVDEVLAKLAPLGLAVAHRTPVTSAGHRMHDRVILRLAQ